LKKIADPMNGEACEATSTAAPDRPTPAPGCEPHEVADHPEHDIQMSNIRKARCGAINENTTINGPRIVGTKAIRA
jgi:hypothetical protein